MQVNNPNINKLQAPQKQVQKQVQKQEQQSQEQQQSYLPGYKPVLSSAAQSYNQSKSVLDNFSDGTLTRFRVAQAKAVGQVGATQNVEYKNDLRTMFKENKSVIYAMIPRTFNAKDTNGDGLIKDGEQAGTFLNAVEKLDYLKHIGINTLHLLPIHEPGKTGAMGTAGSVYAPENYLAIDSQLDDKNDPRTVKEEFKHFIKECHDRGIKVMVDLPSCASVDLYNSRPDLMAIDSRGIPKTPQGWQDIRMFEPWADKDNRVLNDALVEYHKDYVDMCLDLGIDGIRADVARAKPPEFWDIVIPYARSKDSEFAFLAETYTYEDASPMMNMPHDRPEDCLNAGFDSYYGQYHIFHGWETAKEFHDNMILNLEMSQKLEPGKSLIGSFATHDDRSPMSNGGVVYCNLTSGLQATLPMTNPYIVTGFESGDRYLYDYAGKTSKESSTDSYEYIVHPEMVDIFNLSRAPGGENPEIGEYMSQMMEVRKQYEDVITKGSYIPLDVSGNKNDKIIAYARHLNGKTLLAIANKDVNTVQSGSIKVPGLGAGQLLKDLSPAYGSTSKYSSTNEGVNVELGPARFHLFEINTPSIEKQAKQVYKQKL